MLVTDGTLSRLYMEAAGLNVANAVYEKLFGKHDVKINCAAADFVATDGVLDSRIFALDTDDAVIDMDGTISLKTEEMNLNIHPHTKGFRVFSLAFTALREGDLQGSARGGERRGIGGARCRGYRARVDQPVCRIDSLDRTEQQQAAAVPADARRYADRSERAATGTEAEGQGGARVYGVGRGDGWREARACKCDTG